jgi:Protein of unknown function (DUF2950)
MKVLNNKSSSRSMRRLLADGAISLSCLAICLLVVCGVNQFTNAQAPQPPLQKNYNSPDEAMNDLITATKAKDISELGKIFGPDVKELVSNDPIQQKDEFEDFSNKIARKAQLSKKTEESYVINIGDEGWPFPVPIVKHGDRWAFDTKAGVEEIVTRRIGENELDTINVCKAYALAQWEYFLEGDWDGDLVHEFAQKFISTKGEKDGLYWPTREYDTPSPMGPFMDSAYFEGYRVRDETGKIRNAPYHGYYFRILKAQGPYAPGGRYDYVINDNMIGGFALVAYPAKYDSSGVMTFIINQQGRVYQKDLGPKTEAIAKRMKEYNPDPSWKPVMEEEE